MTTEQEIEQLKEENDRLRRLNDEWHERFKIEFSEGALQAATAIVRRLREWGRIQGKEELVHLRLPIDLEPLARSLETYLRRIVYSEYELKIRELESRLPKVDHHCRS